LLFLIYIGSDDGDIMAINFSASFAACLAAGLKVPRNFMYCIAQGKLNAIHLNWILVYSFFFRILSKYLPATANFYIFVTFTFLSVCCLLGILYCRESSKVAVS